MGTTDHVSVDGRRARRDRNRDRVVDAVLDAIEAGDLAPSHQRVSHLSGMSERSVFRYFRDLDDMHAAALERAVERYGPILEIDHEGRGSVEDRIDALIEQRLRLWVNTGPASAAMRIRSLRQPVLRAAMPPLRVVLRAQLDRHLDGMVDGFAGTDRSSVVAMVEIIVSYESFRLLLEEGATADDVRTRWRFALTTLLVPGSVREH